MRDVASRTDRLMTRIMDHLAHVSRSAALIGGFVSLAAVVFADMAARAADIRLVPIYLPVLCVLFWTMRRGMALLFALAAAIVAVVPDLMVTRDPISVSAAVNAVVRAASYLFLAVIVTAYRESYDDADLRAMYDGLTGVLNKMPFQAAVERQLADARRSRRTLLIAFVDLDEFKEVNTRHGHAGGDAVLRSFSQEAMAAVRGSDAVGRLGGDEFGFMLGAATPQSAEALAHVLHQRLVTALNKTGLALSCSMGGLVVPPEASFDGADLLHMADAIMMHAKADGKGKVITRQAEAKMFA